MSSDHPSENLLSILRMIRDRGGTVCSGTCHHRKPGELHCHTISQELSISSSGVKERILELVRLGLLVRHRICRLGTYPLTEFTVSEKGRRALEALNHPSG
ncbi:MAG: hypothetical protein AB1646_05915 [Thermodesulfobacteriota bacterium]